MTEHHFTDETATVVVLNSLIKDMHHALDRIAFVTMFAAAFFVVRGSLLLADERWIPGGLSSVFAAVCFVGATETRRRRRKYHPGTKGGAR